MSDPFHHDKRKPINALRYAKIFARQEGRCAGQCKRKIDTRDDPQVDHIISLACGGTDDDDNLQILCGGCHAIKTKGDISDAASIKHSYINHFVPKEYRRSKSWGRR